MRFHYNIVSCVILVLLLAGPALAGDLEDRFAAQLNHDTQQKVDAAVSQRLAQEVEALRVPAALPKPSPARHASPVASATSARALPNGELTAVHLECKTVKECSMASGDSALLAAKGH